MPESLESLKLLPLWEHPLGEVFAAGDGKGDRALQLTVLRRELMRGDQAVRRCVDTNAMLADLESPYIPRLLEARRVADGRVVLAMERLQGMPLGQHMLDGPMAPGRVIGILRQLCRAFDVAHGIGVRHGALSVASVILVEHEGRADAVRLLDFGLEDELTAEAMGAHEVETQPLSPEKLAGRGMDPREDVYLLGVVGYAALAGTPVFRGDAAAVRAAHERATPDPLDCDAPLADVILRCLAKDPAKRFADMRSIDDALIGAQEISGFTTGWDDLRPMAGSSPSSSGSHVKGKSVSLGSIGKIPSGPYGVVPVEKAKSGMSPAEKLAERLKADKKSEPEAAKTGMSPAEKLAERLKAEKEKKQETEGAKLGMTPAEKLAERLKAERRARAEAAEAEKKAKAEGEKPGVDEKAEAEKKAKADAEKAEAEKKARAVAEKAEAEKKAKVDAEKKLAAEPKPEPEKKLELKQVEPEKKLEAPRNIAPSASATFDATELIEDLQSAGESGAFAAPPSPPPIKRKDEPSGRHTAATPVPAGAAKAQDPVAAPPPPTTKGKSSGSSGSSFDRAATLGASPASSPIAQTSGSFERASTLGLSLGRSSTPTPAPVPLGTGGRSSTPTPVPMPPGTGGRSRMPTPAPMPPGASKTPTVPPAPAVAPAPAMTGKPTPVATIDSNPIPLVKRDALPTSLPKPDGKPLGAKVDSHPIPVPVPVPKADIEPTPMAKPDDELAAPEAAAGTPKPETTAAIGQADAAEPVPPVAAEEPAARNEADAAKPVLPVPAAEPAAPIAEADGAVSMSIEAVEAVDDPDDAPPARAESPEPSAAIMAPRPVETTGEEPKKRPAWLMVAGLALIVGLPVAWLATRDDAPTTTAAAESKPKGGDVKDAPAPAPSVPPMPPTPSVEPTAEGGTPTPDPVAEPDVEPPAADDGTAPVEPVAEPVAEPKPKIPSGGGGGGGGGGTAPSPQEKARELVRAGDKAYAAGQLAKAEGKYKAALAESARTHAAAAGLGRIAFNKAAYSEAASYYSRAVKASAGNGEYRILYGDALFKLGKYADAKVQYTKAKSLRNGQADGRLKKVQAKLGS